MSKITDANEYVTQASAFLANFLQLAGVAVPPVGIAISAVRAFITWLHNRNAPDAPPLTPEQLAAFVAETVQKLVAVDDEYIARLKAQAGQTDPTVDPTV